VFGIIALKQPTAIEAGDEMGPESQCPASILVCEAITMNVYLLVTTVGKPELGKITLIKE
jgi:hypothetical protein